MNLGDYIGDYASPPPNVHIESWYPQPAVIPEVDLFIHHGGNNSFNEALYFRQAGDHHALLLGRSGQCRPDHRHGLWRGSGRATSGPTRAPSAFDPSIGCCPTRKWPSASGSCRAICRRPKAPTRPADLILKVTEKGSMSSSSAPHITEAAKAAGLTQMGATARCHRGPVDLQRQAALEAGRGRGERTVEAGLWVCTPRAPGGLSLPGDEALPTSSAGGRPIPSITARLSRSALAPWSISPRGLDRALRCRGGRCATPICLVRAPTAIDRGAAPILRGPQLAGPLKDWGPVADHDSRGQSVTGRHSCCIRGRAGRRETGNLDLHAPAIGIAMSRATSIATSSPGAAPTTHESGEVIEIEPDTVAFFPEGWKGTCRVSETVRKVYMIR